MSSTVLYMSMSLDGFIAGPNERPDNGLGDGGDRLHEWAFSTGDSPDDSGIPGRPDGVNGEVYDEMMSTGAVVAGRGPSSPPGVGPAITTMASRSSSSAAASPVPRWRSGRW